MNLKINKSKLAGLILGLLLIISLGTGCALHGGVISRESSVSPIQGTMAAINANSQATLSSTSEPTLALPDFADLIAEIRPSVVAISTVTTMAGFFGRSFAQEGAGSGWIVDKNGLIVTNNHVVEDASSVTITLEDGRTFEAQSIRTDTAADLALIKIDAVDLPALAIGDSSSLKVGEWVVALGNSMGLGISATKGIVSALEVSLSGSPYQTLDNLIQTDAAINPGNSGGPLLNLAGKVIGINSAKVAEVGVEGMGYAISMEEAWPVIEKLKSQIT